MLSQWLKLSRPKFLYVHKRKNIDKKIMIRLKNSKIFKIFRNSKGEGEKKAYPQVDRPRRFQVDWIFPR